jgi:hypothetical protein
VCSNGAACQATRRHNADVNADYSVYGDAMAYLDASPNSDADSDTHTSTYAVDYRRLLREPRLVA